MRECEDQVSEVSCYPNEESVSSGEGMINSVKCWEEHRGDQTLNTEFSNAEVISDLNECTQAHLFMCCL